MSYGLYAPDLRSVALSDVDLDTARRMQHGDLVICSERMKTYGFEVDFKFVNFWSVKFYRWLGELRLGFLHINWRKLRYKTADKIVEGKKQ